MYIAKTTYRIQFTADFTFKDLEKRLPYLEKLGVDTIYASPVFKAQPGSTHGYDVTDFAQLNPELGSEEEFIQLIGKLHESNMGWIQDIVPNHMAYSLENPYIVDVLKYGKESQHAYLFDVYWEHHDRELSGRLMLPVLGEELADVIENGELAVRYHKGEFLLNYYEKNFPVNPASADKIMAIGRQKNFISDQAPSTADTASFQKLCKHVSQNNELLREIADMQYYVLCHWQSTERKINYRRFFTVNDLICLRQEDPKVFETTHRLIAEYCEKGYFQGVRVDHVDGLLKPTEYLNKLRSLLGESSYILVEKILGKNEKMPENWPVQGTTGYDFLGAVNELLIKTENAAAFTEIYHAYIGGEINYLTMVERKKRFILRKRMAGELENLLYLLSKSSAKADENYNYREALTYLLTLFPVYRTYIENKSQRGWHKIFENIAADHAGFEHEYNELKKVFFLHKPGDMKFVLRFQQLSGPLAAKGVEDTTFYQYNRFISQNEVGDDPMDFGEKTGAFHKYITERQEQWPLAMNNSSTHDTKRGEDTRARLAAISTNPESWSSFITKIDETILPVVPAPNDRYMIIQSLVGAWPFDGNPDGDFKQRFQEFLRKALREGKNKTSWASPNRDYENICFSYSKKLMENERSRKTISDIVDKNNRQGIRNSINNLILKFTLPGIPDIYQGCESWNFSFVDPDNRRSVDYERFDGSLDELHASANQKMASDFIGNLWQHPADEKLKIAITQKMVQLRRAEPDLLTHGAYIPLETGNNTIAYLRRHKFHWLFVFLSFEEDMIFTFDKLKLPEDLPENWTNVFSGASGKIQELKPSFPIVSKVDSLT